MAARARGFGVTPLRDKRPFLHAWNKYPLTTESEIRAAAKDCPTWPGAKRLEHWPIEDPSYGGYEDFVTTRDDLAQRIDELVLSFRDA